MSKMKNESVIAHFVERSWVNVESHTGSLKYDATNNKLMNYGTCIGQWVAGRLYINVTKYSVSTSKLQNMTKRMAPVEFREILNVDINTRDLEKSIISQYFEEVSN